MQWTLLVLWSLLHVWKFFFSLIDARAASQAAFLSHPGGTGEVESAHSASLSRAEADDASAGDGSLSYSWSGINKRGAQL